MLNNEQEIREEVKEAIVRHLVADRYLGMNNIDYCVDDILTIKPRAKRLVFEVVTDQDCEWECLVGDTYFRILSHEDATGCMLFDAVVGTDAEPVCTNMRDFDKTVTICTEHAEQLAWKLLGVEETI